MSEGENENKVKRMRLVDKNEIGRGEVQNGDSRGIVERYKIYWARHRTQQWTEPQTTDPRNALIRLTYHHSRRFPLHALRTTHFHEPLITYLLLVRTLSPFLPLILFFSFSLGPTYYIIVLEIENISLLSICSGAFTILLEMIC